MTTKKPANLQDNFLNQIRMDNIPVVIFLINGYQIRGTVRSFDNFTMLLDVDGRQQMIYKHAVSTIAPARNLTFYSETKTETVDS